MKNATNRFLDALAEKSKAEGGTGSDYRLAQILGVRPNIISNYRRGVSQMDDDIALRVAEALGERPILVIAEVRAERGRTAREKRFWSEAARGKVAAVILSAAASALSPLPSEARGQGSSENPGVYYVKCRRRFSGAPRAPLTIPLRHRWRRRKNRPKRVRTPTAAIA